MKNVFLSFIIISLFTLSCEKIWDATDSNQESSAERLVGKLPAMSFNKDTTACTKTGNAWAFILNNKVDSVWYITSYIADKNCVCVRGFYATKTKPVQKFIASVLFLNQNKVTKLDSIKPGWNW